MSGARPSSPGISFEQAQRIAYPFAHFVLVREPDLTQTGVWEPLMKLTEDRMVGASKDSRVESISMHKIL